MTTFVKFNPSPSSNFQFQATLDGNLYTVICTFNAYGQRYYFTIYDLTQTVILSRPIIGSPDDFDIDLIALFFDSTMIFRESSQTFEIAP
jgi:hypothetical protein